MGEGRATDLWIRPQTDESRSRHRNYAFGRRAPWIRTAVAQWTEQSPAIKSACGGGVYGVDELASAELETEGDTGMGGLP